MLIRLAKSQLFRSTAALTVYQASSYILAMVSVPYLSRTLGVAGYGTLSFSISLNAYLWLIIAWGFSRSASREIAQAGGDDERLREIFWRTMIAKLMLSVAAIVVLMAVACVIGRVPATFYIIILPGLMNILSAVLSVDWFVYGLQRMTEFLFCFIGGRVLAVCLTFVLVHNPSDAWIACLLQAGGGVFASVSSFMAIRQFFRTGRPVIRLRPALDQIWHDRHYFVTQSRSTVYSTAAPLILAVVSGSVAIGLFSAAERIVRITMSAILPLSTSMYPHVNALMTHSRDAAARAASLALVGQLAFGGVLLCGLLAGADHIVGLVLGSRFTASADVLRCLALLPLVSGLTEALSTQFLIPLGRKREVSLVMLVCTGMYFLGLAILGYRLGAAGAAVALISSEALAGACLAVLLFRKEKEFARLAAQSAVHAPAGLCKQLALSAQKVRKKLFPASV